jgi:hypothetical protein
MFSRKIFVFEGDPINSNNFFLEILIVFTIKYIRYGIWIILVLGAVGKILDDLWI